MIKTLIFDLGNVIVPFDFSRGYAQLQAHCSLPADEIRRRISAVSLSERYESGKIDSAQFVQEMERLLGVDLGFEEFARIWNSVFYPETSIPDEMLEALGEKYPLILLSNTNPLHFSMLQEQYPIFRHFDEYVLSYQVGAMKPSPEIYQEALRRAGCRPEECFFTDDIAAYVEGARALGIDAVQFQSCQQIQKEMRARGIRW